MKTKENNMKSTTTTKTPQQFEKRNECKAKQNKP